MVAVHEVRIVEEGKIRTRPVPINKAEFRRSVERLTRGHRFIGSPKEAARELLKLAQGEELREVERVAMTGDWEGEAYRGEIYSMVPVRQTGPVPLTPVAEVALGARYEQWCIVRGGGDCLGLFEDGPYLRTDDRRTLALALAFGSVLDETLAALGHELSPRAVMASLLWAVGLYLALWLVPEPTTKAVAASLTMLLVAWLGVDTVWGLMDGWALMATQAHRASTFEDLRTAGVGFAKVLGTDAARVLILAVTALTGRTLAEVSGLVRSLPGYRLARLQLEVQGVDGWVLVQVERVQVVAASERALAVVVSPEAALAGAMMSRNSAAHTISAPGRPRATEVYRHRVGNQQVELDNGQRWHLPRDKSVADIPTSDPLGDELQAAAKEVAAKWGPEKYTPNVRDAIKDFLRKGDKRAAELLERRARGQWVEDQLNLRFPGLTWNERGVDVTGPLGQSYHYEILSGTESNFLRHGRRMASSFFRMIFF
ncbi:hypothetical protein [Archangium sp.]|uniref:SitA5 family polymorphic toxin n=1 Tax=Archangium sp. TaxID=1872627 RepID=UPI002EDBA3E2